jgi:hypothetical protein
MSITAISCQDLDTNIKRISHAVVDRLGCKVSGFQVGMIDGMYILMGKTNSFYHKQLASHAALAAVEHVSISNRIEVI